MVNLIRVASQIMEPFHMSLLLSGTEKRIDETLIYHTHMDHDLFIKEYNTYKSQGMRDGQALMNALFTLDRELYDKIQGSDSDPFYDDAKLDKFWTAFSLKH